MIKIATRGSELALAQANYIAAGLQEHGCESELLIIKTTGDLRLDKPLAELGGKGVFTKEVDEAVLSGAADVAVHSLKDMPVEDEAGLVLACVPERESDRDVLVLGSGKHEATLDTFGKGIIGCGSVRRRAQLAFLLPEAEFTDVRGNIGTRLKKMYEKNWAGLVVAEAALHRLKIQVNNFALDGMLPAAGQGALGLRARMGDKEVLDVLQKINCEPSYIRAEAERAFLKALGGGCHVPAGIRTSCRGSSLQLNGAVFSPDGKEKYLAQVHGPASQAGELGETLAEQILQNGGNSVL